MRLNVNINDVKGESDLPTRMSVMATAFILFENKSEHEEQEARRQFRKRLNSIRL